MTHQDIAGGLLRWMGSQPEKVDFQGDPKVGQRPDFFKNILPGPNFARKGHASIRKDHTIIYV